MNNNSASDILWGTWQSGSVIEELPQPIRPQSRIAGYEIQSTLEARSAKPLYGWKIAATSVAGQKHIGVDGPMAGRILAEQVREQGGAIDLANNRMLVAECEFAFKMGHDLPPRKAPYMTDEVLAAVASLHPAIEVPDSRYRAFETVGAAQLIADNACAHLFMLGSKTTANWRAMDLAQHAVTATMQNKGGPLVHHHGIGSNVLGDPRIALCWLANELSGLGITLKAGEVITTGTCVIPMAIKPGDDLRASFGAIGEISAQFVLA